MPQAPWQHYLPILILVVVMAIRLRRVNQARRMHLWRLGIAPAILGLGAIFLGVTMPPDLTGAAIFAGAAAVGAGLGWQRARLMKIAYDPATDSFTLQQSPLAVALLMGVIVLRRLLLPGAAAFSSAGHSPHALWLIDGFIGFGLGMIVAKNAELWLRAKGLRARMLASTFA